jgi:hypothetical protein
MTPEHIYELVERANSVSTGLGSASNELTSTLVEISEAIRDLRLGVTASVAMEPGVSLEFVRENGTYSLVVDASGKRTTVANASRKHRVLAVDFVEALLERLVESAESMSTATSTALARARNVLECIRSANGRSA